MADPGKLALLVAGNGKGPPSSSGVGGEDAFPEGPEDAETMGLDVAAADVVDAMKSGDVGGVKAALLDFISMARSRGE